MAYAAIEVRYEWDGASPAAEEVATQLADGGMTFPDGLRVVTEMALQQQDGPGGPPVAKVVSVVLKEYS